MTNEFTQTTNRFGTLITGETYKDEYATIPIDYKTVKENGGLFIKFSDGRVKRLIKEPGVFRILPL